MKLPPVILASASPRRAELLRLLELDFKVLPGTVEEVSHDHLTPLEVCQLNAHRKARAIAKNDFAKAAKTKVKVAPDLAARVEKRLVGRMQSDLGLARRAGQLVLGFDNVLRRLNDKAPPQLLVEAQDGAADGRRKLAGSAAARGLRVETIDCLTRAELSLALGRENVIHAAVNPGPLAERLISDSARLKGFRVRPAADETAGSSPARNERDV